MLKQLRTFLPMAEKIKVNKSMPILEHICIKDRIMRFTDLENIITIPVDDERNYTLPLDVIKLIMKQRPSQLQISVLTDNKIRVKFDANTVMFPFANTDEYPVLPDEKFRNIGLWGKDVFIDLYKQINFVSKDELKPALNGIYINQNSRLNSCATDTHSLKYIEGLQKYEQGKDFKGIINVKAIKLLSRFVKTKVELQRSKHLLKFVLPNKVEVYTRLIDEIYPDFLAVLEQESAGNITFEKTKMLKAVKASKSFANDSKECCVNISNDNVEISGNDIDRHIAYESSVPIINQSCKELKIGFNLKYFEKILKDINSGKIVWYYDSPVAPSIFKPQEESNQTHLLMPVRLEAEDAESYD